MEDAQSIVAIEEALGHEFRDRRLLAMALTHPSFAAGPAGDVAGAHPGAAHQRLEFLGDAVWGLLVGEYLFQQEPRWTEGELSRARAYCAAASFLASAAEAIGIPEALRLGPGEADAGGRRKVRILAAAFEALLGAVFLDAGYEAARAAGRRVLDRLYPRWQSPAPPYDPKSLLQIRAAARGMVPRYALIEKTGSPHAPRFAVSVSIGESVRALGEGDSRRAAEREAAIKALALMDTEGGSAPISRGEHG